MKSKSLFILRIGLETDRSYGCQIPKAFFAAQAIAIECHDVKRLHCMNLFIRSQFRFRVVHQVTGDVIVGDFQSYAERLDQWRQLRTANQFLRVVVVIKEASADMIAGEDNLLCDSVKQQQRKLTHQVQRKHLIPLLIRRQHQFDIGDTCSRFPNKPDEIADQLITIIETQVSCDHKVVWTHQRLHFESGLLGYMKASIAHPYWAMKQQVAAIWSLCRQPLPEHCQLLSLRFSDALSVEVVDSCQCTHYG